MATAFVEEDPGTGPGGSTGVLGVLRALGVARGGVEARRVEATREVVAACGQELLAEKGWVSVEELTVGQREKWRASAKSVAVGQIQVCEGLGQDEARALVGVSVAPGLVPVLVVNALERGWVTWWQVRLFWTRCGRLSPEAAQQVAVALFGADPGLAAAERLDPDGQLGDGAWFHAQFRAALDREALAAEGLDPEAERARRKRAYQARGVSVSAHEDGTGTLSLTTDLVALCGIHARVDRVARLLRKGGDERTLDQLRADVVAALLLHGVIPVLDKDDDDLSPGDMEELARVVAAQPRVNVQVVIGWDSLVGAPTCPHCGHAWVTDNDEPDDSDDDSDEQDDERLDDSDDSREGDTDGTDVTDTGEAEADGEDHDLDEVEEFDSDEDLTDEDLTGDEGASAGDGAVDDAAVRARWRRRKDRRKHRKGRGSGQAGSKRRGQRGVRRGGVGEILGSLGAFISPGQARELVGRPGTTLNRLLFDPADGRLVERSIASYRPDADMRRQVKAADLFSRAPGSRQPAGSCEIDHVLPWSAEPGGGQTTEANLASVNKGYHQEKTKGRVSSVMNARRDLTWTTLLGWSVATRVHDYRQYLQDLTGPPPDPDLQGAGESSVHHQAGRAGRAGRAGGHGTGEGSAHHQADQAGQTGEAGGVPMGREEFLAVLRQVFSEAARDGTDPAGRGGVDPEVVDRVRARAAQALYAELVRRGPGAFLVDDDDLPGAGEHGGRLGGWMFLTHAHPVSGRPRSGPPAEHPATETVLGLHDPDDRAGPDRPKDPPATGWAFENDDPPPF